MPFFKEFPEFVNLDSRKNRGFSPVTAESLDARHQVSMPESLLKGRTVLDLGSCLAATGHWALAHAAKHYTGVEAQADLFKSSHELLSVHWSPRQFDLIHSDIRSWLTENQHRRFDIVVMVGVIYAFLDTYNLLKLVTNIAEHAVVIDSLYPWHTENPDWPIIDVTQRQNINSSVPGLSYSGLGCRISPAALKLFMQSLSFDNPEGLLHPEPLEDKSQHDTYNTLITRDARYPQLPARFLTRFYRVAQAPVQAVSDAVVQADGQALTAMPSRPQMLLSESWTFDADVAQRFGQEARDHIPDYERVIDLSINLVQAIYPNQRNIGIVDVGSALGYTVDQFRRRGYGNVWGIESSEAMIQQSLHPRFILKSNQFVARPWHVVLANWTLHFISARKEYLEAIYQSLSPGGMLLLTDKMSHSGTLENLYHDFKRANGVSEEEIERKKQSLTGVLTTRPLSWYLTVLNDLGFQDSQVINSRFMFTTIYARKY